MAPDFGVHPEPIFPKKNLIYKVLIVRNTIFTYL